jgi:hypothetical protein
MAHQMHCLHFMKHSVASLLSLLVFLPACGSTAAPPSPNPAVSGEAGAPDSGTDAPYIRIDPECNQLDALGSPIEGRGVESVSKEASGGMIRDGLYELTKVSFALPPDKRDRPIPTDAWRMRITGVRADVVRNRPDGSIVRNTYRLTTMGQQLFMESVCEFPRPQNGDADGDDGFAFYSASSNGLRLTLLTTEMDFTRTGD